MGKKDQFQEKIDHQKKDQQKIDHQKKLQQKKNHQKKGQGKDRPGQRKVSGKFIQMNHEEPEKRHEKREIPRGKYRPEPQKVLEEDPKKYRPTDDGKKPEWIQMNDEE